MTGGHSNSGNSNNCPLVSNNRSRVSNNRSQVLNNRSRVSVTVLEFEKTVPKYIYAFEFQTTGDFKYMLLSLNLKLSSFKRPVIAQFSNFVQEKWPNRRLSQRIKHEMYVLFFYTSVPLIFAYQWHVLVDVERARRPTGDDQDEGAARRGEKDLSQH